MISAIVVFSIIDFFEKNKEEAENMKRQAKQDIKNNLKKTS